MDDVKISENSFNGYRHGCHETPQQPPTSHTQLTYAEYLKLKQLLSAQTLRSVQLGQPAHHEHLFMITHQVYELWFKQILHELDSIMVMFKNFQENGQNQFEIIKRLNRIFLIMKICIEQFAILETMTAVDFLEFRNILNPASGFQSLQFRLIEIKLGLKMDKRLSNQNGCLRQFWPQNKDWQSLERAEAEPSLFQLIEKWLESFPWNRVSYERFRAAFKECTTHSYVEEYKILEARNNCAGKIEALKKKENLFKYLFEADSQRNCRDNKQRRLSPKAMLGALMISVYQAEPEFGPSYHVLNLICDIDLCLMKWRYYHVLMVQKMIGTRNAGTGGSSGYAYLQSTLCDEYQIFIDLANIPIFLTRPNLIPSLREMQNENLD